MRRSLVTQKAISKWEAIDQLAVAYVIESQFGQPGREL
jgi:hypothetical protein